MQPNCLQPWTALALPKVDKNVESPWSHRGIMVDSHGAELRLVTNDSPASTQRQTPINRVREFWLSLHIHPYNHDDIEMPIVRFGTAGDNRTVPLRPAGV